MASMCCELTYARRSVGPIPLRPSNDLVTKQQKYEKKRDGVSETTYDRLFISGDTISILIFSVLKVGQRQEDLISCPYVCSLLPHLFYHPGSHRIKTLSDSNKATITCPELFVIQRKSCKKISYKSMGGIFLYLSENYDLIPSLVPASGCYVIL